MSTGKTLATLVNLILLYGIGIMLLNPTITTVDLHTPKSNLEEVR